MVIYYTLLLLFLYLFSKDDCAKVLILSCMLIVSTGDIIGYKLDQYVSFHVSVVLVELLSIIFMSLLFYWHRNILIFLVFILSALFNAFLFQLEFTTYYQIFYRYFEIVNIGLYELMVFICLCTTNLQSKLNQLSEILKYIIVLFKNNNLKILAGEDKFSYLIRFIGWHYK